jgi:hypothetical protein
MAEVIAMLRIQPGKIRIGAAIVSPNLHNMNHDSNGGGRGDVEVNQGDRAACVLVSVDESLECVSVVVARMINDLLQLGEKAVGGFSTV